MPEAALSPVPPAAAIAARLDAAMVPLLLDRIERRGETESGARNFYAAKARAGTIFSDYDPALVDALARWPRAPRRIVEIGGGIGGFSMLAAVAGFEVTCLEHDAARVELGEDFAAMLRELMPDAGARFRIERARFPSRRVQVPGALAVMTNFVASATAEQQDAFVAALVAQPWAVIDVDRFFTKAPDLAARAAVVRRLEAAGATGAPFLDLGDSACFWRFRGRR